MGNQEIWGIIVAAWVLFAAGPYLFFTFKREGEKSPLFNKMLWGWNGGFIPLIVISQITPYPVWGVIWTVAYAAGCLILLAVLHRRRRTIFQSRAVRGILSASILWLIIVQMISVIGDFYSRYSDWDALPLLLLNVGPPAIVALAWLFWRWTSAGSVRPDETE